MNANSTFDTIALAGELDIARRDEVRQALRIDGPGSGILVDFSEVVYADSTVIAQLLRFYNDAGELKRRVAVLIVAPQLIRLLQYAGLSEIFPLFTERSAALNYLSEVGDKS
ncbi:MAG TPA: STAS domain-containing protein [Candidatus Baltobacteraceae bacterium]|jgi:anti-anti-sigma factor|nr:STAS domain-containing protein [Candidatus Baltobacteraceae bacterium]